MGSDRVPGYPTLAVHKCFRFNNRIDETQISLRLKTPTENELFLQANVVHESWKFNLYDWCICSCILSISVFSQPILAHSRINNKQSLKNNSLWEISLKWKILHCYGLYKRFSIHQLIYIFQPLFDSKNEDPFLTKKHKFWAQTPSPTDGYSITFGRCIHGKK